MQGKGRLSPDGQGNQSQYYTQYTCTCTAHTYTGPQRERGMEGGREGGMDGRREGGREGGMEGWMEGGASLFMYIPALFISSFY